MPSIFALGRAIVLIVFAGLISLTVVSTPRMETMWIEIDAKPNPTSDIKIHFLNDKKVTHELSTSVIEHQGKNVVLFALPQHIANSGIFLDLGKGPGAWVINKISIKSRFLLFHLQSYHWNIADIATQSSSYLDTSRIKAEKKLEQLTVTTSKWPFRFHFNIDKATLTQSADLIFAKAITIIALIAIAFLLITPYLWNLISTRVKDAGEMKKLAIDQLGKHRAISVIGALLLMLLILVLNHDVILHPGLFVEDSMEFTDSLRGSSNLLDPSTYQYYRGYQVLLSEWLIAITSWFPLQAQPYLYTGIGILFACLAMIAASNSGLIKQPVMLLFAPTLIFIGSFNVPAMYLSLTGILFSSTALLIALAVRPAPDSWLRFALYALFLCVLTWSGPYASQILPIAVLLALFVSSGKRTALLMVLGAVAVLYTTATATSMVQFANVLDPVIRTHFYNALVEHVFLLSIAAPKDFKVGVAIICVVISLLAFFRHDRLYVKHSLVFIASAVASLATYFISFKYTQYGGELISAHLVIAQFAWMIFVVLTLDRIIQACPIASSPRLSVVIMLLVTAIFFAGRKQAEFPQNEIAPDHDLTTFIEAIKYVNGVKLNDNEFIQLWDVNSQAYVTSYRKGATHADAKSISIEAIPLPFRHFVLPVDLRRDKDKHLQFYFSSLTVIDSDRQLLKVPTESTAYHRNKFLPPL